MATNEIWQLQQTPNINIQQVVTDLLHGHQTYHDIKPSCQYPIESKMSALKELARVLIQDKTCTASSFLSILDDLFKGIRTCLNCPSLMSLSSGAQSESKEVSSSQVSTNNNQVSDAVVEVVLKANQVLFEMMPDICHQEDLEIQMAQLIPIFIENLGSPKAVVRKSTHKCIGTYVKLTKKIEFVILHIIHTGLENSNSRTRQHSMLVIPALLSLKTTVMEKECTELKELITAVIKRIKSDSSEIVSKTGKKLILELQKCYPNAFKVQYIDTMRNHEDRQICLAVLANDDVMLKQILQGQQQALQQLMQTPGGKSSLQHKQGNELSIVGREIMGGNSLTPNLTKSGEQDLLMKEAKPEPKYPRFSNGLLFSFVKDEQIETLTNENHQWKERTTVIESIEIELNQVLATSDRKMDFLPYATPFIGFIMQFIKDINFKICLTAIQITSKLLVLSIVNIKKHYSQLVTTLIEKLSDSKVVIRQAVLKCCGLIITSHTPGLFSYHAIRFLQHTNWHVREGILHLTANCLIAQSQQDELNNASGITIEKSSKHSSTQGSSSGQPGDNTHLALSSTLISELCQVTKTETKSKIQQMAVDCLALCLDISPNRNKTEQLMMREYGIGMDFSQDKDRLVTKDFQLISQIKERQNPDCLPTMQIDGSIEFKPAGITPTCAQDGPTGQPIEIGAKDGLKSPKGFHALSGAQTDSKQGVKHQQKLLKREEDDLQLQMRFQQERVQNNQSHAATAQKSPLLPQQQQPFDLVVPQASLQLQPNYQLQNRQQHSLSTINNPALNSLRDSKAAKPKVETKGLTPEYEVPTPVKSALINKSRHEAMGSGLPQKDDFLEAKSASKPEDDNRDQAKISMWLPSFQGQQQVQSQYTSKQITENKIVQSPYVNDNSNQRDSKAASQKPRGHQPAQVMTMATNPVKLDRLNATASSSATFVDDGRSIITNTTLVSSQNNKITSGGPSNSRLQNVNARMLKSPAQSENQKNAGQPQNIKTTKPSEGYTPEPHANKPRHIQSNEIRQRTLEDVSLSQASPSPKHVRIGGTTQNDFISIQQSPRMINETQSSKTGQVGGGHNQVISHSEIKVQQRNMSQSSGAPGGFHVDKSQINERLQLLKSTFKYKNPSEAEMQSNLEETKSFDNVDSHNKYRADKGGKANSEYNARGPASKPTALNNNNYMLQTAGRASGTGAKILGNPQQTHNSFGFSNMSTNMNNTNSNHYNASSSSANKQIQSSNTTGYNFGGAATGKGRTGNAYANNIQSNTIGGIHGQGQGFATGNSNTGSATGPIKATALPQHDFLQTIQIGENPDNPTSSQLGNNVNDGGGLTIPGSLNLKSHKSQPTRTRKPPVAGKTSASTALGTATPNHDGQRANSVTMNEQHGNLGPSVNLHQQIEQQPLGASTVTHYNAPEEPLRNPELQFKQSIENLKSDDWQKAFDSLNVVKRIAMFHKHLLAASSGAAAKECIKSVVKQTDSLRSQVAKNACMTLQTIFSELSTKDLDPNIDLVLAVLLKKATDTNHFVSEQAEKALTMVCHACTDSKVFNCLQAQSGRASALKQKICMCYSTLIAKLGQRINTFRECDRLVKAVVSMLSEGAQEVRNQAKLAILTLKNNLQNGREFEGLLMRCNLTDKQIEQARKVAEQGDYESLSNYANTRYGGSMRGSSMDSRSAAEAQRRTPNHLPRNLASGSDGFAQSSFSDAKMQATFLSGGAGATSQLQNSNYGASNGFGMTGSSNHAFKKRQASVSKPVDPQLMEDFKNMISSCSTNDWNKRLESIDTINDWIARHSITVKQTQSSKFIQLVDIQCKFVQDNNAKVQTKALKSFSSFLQTENLRQLIDQNLTMIVQAMSHNLTSSSPAVRNSSEELLALLASTTEVPSQLIQPLVAQVNLSTNRAKAPLVERLAQIIQQVDQQSIVDRYVCPLLKPNTKLQTEASTNPRLRDALKSLELAVLQSSKNNK